MRMWRPNYALRPIRPAVAFISAAVALVALLALTSAPAGAQTSPPGLNADATLEYLRFDPSLGIAMQPAFSPDVYDYTASIANSAGIPASAGGVDLSHVIRMDPRVNDFRDGGATFDAILTQPGGSPTGHQNDVQQGPFTLPLTATGQPITTGTAVIAILVTAESGATQTYTITMYIRAPVPAAPVSQVLPSDWALKPAAVAAGQPFRLMFLNTGQLFGTSGDISFYNSNSQNSGQGAAAGHASIGGFASEFRVLMSTTAVDARDNTATTGAGVPIYWLNGGKVADNYADFYDGSWDSRVPRNRDGDPLSNTLTVLTGTNADGSGDLRFLPGARIAYRIGRLDQDEGAEIHSATTISRGTRSSRYALSPVLTVAAPGEADTAAALDGLSPSAGELSPPFAPATLAYSVEVPSDTATFTLTPSVSPARTDHQLITISATHEGVSTLPVTPLTSGTGASIPLNFGVNTISVEVIAAGAPAQFYTLVVTRPSDDASLSALQVLPLTGAAGAVPVIPVRIGQTTEYRASVANDVSSITLQPTTHPDATITVNGLLATSVPLRVGANSIQFTIIAANGISLQTYTLTLNRRDPISPPAMRFLPFGSALVPPGFEDGRPFRLMFVSSNYPAASGDIADYNQIGNDEASIGAVDIRPFADQFRALVSTTQVDARDNTATTGTGTGTGVPIFWLGGAKVADNYADFYDGTWDNNVPRNRGGNRSLAFNHAIWTGSDGDGTGLIPYRAGEGGGVQFGRVPVPGGDISFSQATTGRRGFYMLSPLITVEPATPTLTTLEVGPAPEENILTPAFDPTIFAYSVLVRQGNVINVRALDSTGVATISVNGFDLPPNGGTSDDIAVSESGETNISIVLTDTFDFTVTYTLTATRQPSGTPDLVGADDFPRHTHPGF